MNWKFVASKPCLGGHIITYTLNDVALAISAPSLLEAEEIVECLIESYSPYVQQLIEDRDKLEQENCQLRDTIADLAPNRKQEA